MFEENIRYKFRSTEQFSGIYLANHLEIKDGNAILEMNDESVMLNGEMDLYPILKAKLNRIRKKQVRFVCLQNMETFSRSQQKKIKVLLRDDFGLDKPFRISGTMQDREKQVVN